jgi:hypothetical protein
VSLLFQNNPCVTLALDAICTQRKLPHILTGDLFRGELVPADVTEPVVVGARVPCQARARAPKG